LRNLSVDDHELSEGVRAILIPRYDVEVCREAANGENAIKKALKSTPDLIILDIYMPILSGMSAAKEIKARLPEVLIPLFSMNERLSCLARFIYHRIRCSLCCSRSDTLSSEFLAVSGAKILLG
jgi:DNA-binding NarL/FixJ family response regulator